jgi:eukaryotic-like serine/threonine-protein kinase
VTLPQHSSSSDQTPLFETTANPFDLPQFDSSRNFAVKIDRICDRYETSHKAGEPLSLTSLVKAVGHDLPPEALQELVVELVLLDCDLCRKAGRSCNAEMYAALFPAHAAVIAAALAAGRSDRISDASPTPPNHTTKRKESHGFLPGVADVGIAFSPEKTGAVGPTKQSPFFEVPGSTPDAETMLQPPVNRWVKHFQLLSLLGRGGFGEVWLALDTKLQREVALKTPRHESFDQNYLSSFLREARTAARLRHPNIVAVHEVGDAKDKDSAYIVTAFINGPSLKDWLAAGNRPDVRKAVTIVAQVALALEHAHQHGIVHRDVKPANILMDKEHKPYLADFGLARREAGGDESLSVHGKIMGTPNYMSPEQARAEHDKIDKRTDVYSLGVVLYELLTNEIPFRGTLHLLLEQIVSAPAPPFPRGSASPLELEQVCHKCMAKDQAARYQSAGELADDLERFLGGESLRGIPIPLQLRVRKWAWRWRAVLGSLCAGLFVAGSLAGGVWWYTRPVEPTVPVYFETDPPGCEITLVRLNPETEEPDPRYIRTIWGKTPVLANVIGGYRYLVVAVLDDLQFHEVVRYYPKDLKESIPACNYERATIGTREVVAGCRQHSVPLRIPRPDLTTQMAFVRGCANWKPKSVWSTPGWDFPEEGVPIPAFYCDRQELLCNDGSKPNQRIDKPANLLEEPPAYFDQARHFLELSGKRFPSLVEMAYLSEEALALKSGHQTILREGEIQGLFEPPAEFTSTVSVMGNTVLGFKNRLTLAGDPPQSSDAIPVDSSFAPRVRGDWQGSDKDELIAVRGVRSAKPRRTAASFAKVSK